MNVIITIAGLLLMLSPILLVIGLIKPKRILRWSKKPTRLKVIGWWFLFAFFYMMFFGFLLKVTGYEVKSSDNDKSTQIAENNKPPKGKKLEVRGKKLTFYIDTIVVNDSCIKIPLHADGAIPMDGMKNIVKMRIEVDKQVLETNDIEISGIMTGLELGNNEGMTGKDAGLLGNLYFTFPTTKMPNAIIVYNNDNKSIEFDGKAIRYTRQ